MSKTTEKSKNKANIDTKKDPMIENQYWQEVEWTCPIRGKIKQKVLITKYKPSKDTSLNIIRTGNPLIDESPLSELTNEDVEVLE
jgi:hypothetical protein